jgi:predicted Zn-dependent protease
MLRHLVEQGDIVAALAWAMAQAQAQPKGAASAWDALRLAHLAQTEAPPGALATILADRDSPGSTALALASGAWRLGAPSWRQAADPLLAELPKKAAAPKLMAALDKQSSHAPEEAVRVLRSVALERHEPAAVSALARAMVASLRPPSADERLEALGRVTLAPARLDTESLRPDLLEASVRTLEAAQTARRPAQILQAAQMLLWQEPLAVDPVLAIVAWAESASALHRQGGGTPQSDPGLNRLDQLIAQRPQDDAVVQRALTLAQTAAPDRVIGLYQTLLLRHPGDLRLTAELAEAYVRGKDRDAAQKLIDPLIAGHGPEAHDGNVLYAQALILADEDPPKARILLDSAILTGAPQARFFALLAQLNLARNLTDDALEALTRACELAPNDVPLHMQRARLLLGKQHLQQADAIATVLLGAPLTDSQRAQVWLLRADVARESNDVGKTVAALKEALAAQPGDAAVLLRLGRLELQELGTSHDAMVHLRQVAQQEPTNALAHYFLGLALRDQNARAEAKQAFARYLALAPTGDYAVDAKDALDGL